MPSETVSISDAFAATACKLLAEYNARLIAIRQKAEAILDAYYSDERKRALSSFSVRPDHLKRRYNAEMHEFMMSKETFEKLIRKTSQWVEHGMSPKPHMELELEVRLADFEQTLRSTEHFFIENQI